MKQRISFRPPPYPTSQHRQNDTTTTNSSGVNPNHENINNLQPPRRFSAQRIESYLQQQQQQQIQTPSTSQLKQPTVSFHPHLTSKTSNPNVVTQSPVIPNLPTRLVHTPPVPSSTTTTTATPTCTATVAGRRATETIRQTQPISDSAAFTKLHSFDIFRRVPVNPPLYAHPVHQQQPVMTSNCNTPSQRNSSHVVRSNSTATTHNTTSVKRAHFHSSSRHSSPPSPSASSSPSSSSSSSSSSAGASRSESSIRSSHTMSTKPPDKTTGKSKKNLLPSPSSQPPPPPPPPCNSILSHLSDAFNSGRVFTLALLLTALLAPLFLISVMDSDSDPPYGDVSMYDHSSSSSSLSASAFSPSPPRPVSSTEKSLMLTQRTLRALQLWEPHIVVGKSKILLSDTFESRLNAEVAPILQLHLDRIWDPQLTPRLRCYRNHHILVAFSFDKSGNIPGSITDRKTKRKWYVSDIRDVSISLPLHSSRYTFAAKIIETITEEQNSNQQHQHHQNHEEEGEKVKRIRPIAMVTGKFMVELSDVSKLAIQRYCGKNRQFASTELITEPVTEVNTRLLPLFELRRLFHLLARKSWDDLALSIAEIDPIAHSTHALTVGHLLDVVANAGADVMERLNLAHGSGSSSSSSGSNRENTVEKDTVESSSSSSTGGSSADGGASRNGKNRNRNNGENDDDNDDEDDNDRKNRNRKRKRQRRRKDDDEDNNEETYSNYGPVEYDDENSERKYRKRHDDDEKYTNDRDSDDDDNKDDDNGNDGDDVDDDDNGKRKRGRRKRRKRRSRKGREREGRRERDRDRDRDLDRDRDRDRDERKEDEEERIEKRSKTEREIDARATSKVLDVGTLPNAESHDGSEGNGTGMNVVPSAVPLPSPPSQQQQPQNLPSPLQQGVPPPHGLPLTPQFAQQQHLHQQQNVLSQGMGMPPSLPLPLPAMGMTTPVSATATTTTANDTITESPSPSPTLPGTLFGPPRGPLYIKAPKPVFYQVVPETTPSPSFSPMKKLPLPKKRPILPRQPSPRAPPPAPPIRLPVHQRPPLIAPVVQFPPAPQQQQQMVIPPMQMPVSIPMQIPNPSVRVAMPHPFPLPLQQQFGNAINNNHRMQQVPQLSQQGQTLQFQPSSPPQIQMPISMPPFQYQGVALPQAALRRPVQRHQYQPQHQEQLPGQQQIQQGNMAYQHQLKPQPQQQHQHRHPYSPQHAQSQTHGQAQMIYNFANVGAPFQQNVLSTAPAPMPIPGTGIPAQPNVFNAPYTHGNTAMPPYYYNPLYPLRRRTSRRLYQATTSTTPTSTKAT